MIALSQLNDEVKDLTAQKQALEIQLVKYISWDQSTVL